MNYWTTDPSTTYTNRDLDAKSIPCVCSFCGDSFRENSMTKFGKDLICEECLEITLNEEASEEIVTL